MKHFIPFFMPFFLAACVEITDLNQEKEKLSAGFQAVEMPEPNQYSIYIPLKKNEVAYRKLAPGTRVENVQTNMLDAQTSQIMDQEVTAGETYIYEVGHIENGRLSVTRIFQVTVPLDRVFVSGEQQLTEKDLEENQIYGRVYFLRNSRVRTNGLDWTLRANRIIADGGLIYSFPEGATAELGADGRGGGLVQIQARDFHGILNIVLRGEAGGKGNPGDLIPGRAAQGKPGRPGYGRRIPAKSELPDDYCIQKAISAGDGAPGTITGNRGYDGGRGGDSGDIDIQITGELDGSIQSNFYEGLGGEPGDGGPGQQGGLPGEFDEKKNFYMCDYRKAREGPRGPQGEQGSSGKPGLRGRICVKHRSERKCSEL